MIQYNNSLIIYSIQKYTNKHTINCITVKNDYFFRVSVGWQTSQIQQKHSQVWNGKLMNKLFINSIQINEKCIYSYDANQQAYSKMMSQLLQHKMNIQNLIRRMQSNQKPTQNSQRCSTQRRVRNYSTQNSTYNNLSIGFVNQLPNTHGDRSYFKHSIDQFQYQSICERSGQDESRQGESRQGESRRDGSRRDESRRDESRRDGSRQDEGIVGGSNKLERIESELFDIDKMKLKFQSKRRMEGHAHGHSNEKSIIHKSIEKHVLKPSNVPKVMTPTSEFTIGKRSQIKEVNDDGRFSFEMVKPEIKSFQKQTQMEEERMELKQHEEDYFTNRNQHEFQEAKTEGKGNGECLKHSKRGCECESVLYDFMTEMRQKMTVLANRVNLLQETNSKLREKHEKVTQCNLKAISCIEKLSQQRKQLVGTSQKWKQGKLQLQNLLKDVLFKKQKQKQQKQNMNKEDCENYFKIKSKQRSKDKEREKQQLKQRKVIDMRNIGSKSKVQNLLQRLQLRVQKS